MRIAYRRKANMDEVGHVIWSTKQRKVIQNEGIVCQKSLITSYGLENNLLATSSAKVLKAIELVALKNSSIKCSWSSRGTASKKPRGRSRRLWPERACAVANVVAAPWWTPWRATSLTRFGMSCKWTTRTAPLALTNPAAWSVADRRLSSWADRSKRFKGEVIRVSETKLKRSRGYDKYLTRNSGLSLGQPILHQIDRRRWSTSNHGQGWLCEG